MSNPGQAALEGPIPVLSAHPTRVCEVWIQSECTGYKRAKKFRFGTVWIMSSTRAYWSPCFRILIPNEYKEVHFKIINNIQPSNKFIKDRFKIDAEYCVFCKIEIQQLWKLLHNFFSKSLDIDFFSFQNIQFGLL